MATLRQFQEEVYRVIVSECGANPDGLASFATHWPDCVEYRFIGTLGFGGKVWYSGDKVYVSCYKEDETPARLEAVARANEHLKDLTLEEA